MKQQIVDMAPNGSGIRDTARVLHAIISTVLKELKKRINTPTSKFGGSQATKSIARAIWHQSILSGWLGSVQTQSRSREA